jgi:putative SbcD/Mre11-related phosphoesterase
LNHDKLTPAFPHPALILEKNSKKILIISDLHIGWEASLAKNGIHIPSQTPKLLKKILDLMKIHKPTSLIFLGDVKHTVTGAELSEWKEIPNLFEKISEIIQDIKIVQGNHDGNLEPLVPRNVKFISAKGTMLSGNIGVFHGHAWPSIELLKSNYMVMGHLHPVITLKDSYGFRTIKQVWIKTECDLKKLGLSLIKYLGKRSSDQINLITKERNRMIKLIIMPSFNKILGGQPINIKNRYDENLYFGPILRSKSIIMDEAEIYLLDGTLLGKLDDLALKT